MRELPQTCSEVRSNLPLYVGRDLEAPILERVAIHLEGCAACRGISRGLEDTRRRIRSLAGGTSADGGGVGRVPDLWPGVRARLVAEGLVGQGEAVAGRMSAALRAEPARGRLLLGQNAFTRNLGRLRRPGFGLGAGVAAATLFGMVLLSRSDVSTVTLDTTPTVVDAVRDVKSPGMEPFFAGSADAGTRPGVQALPVGAAAPDMGRDMDMGGDGDALAAGALQRVPAGEKSLLELQAELNEAARRAHPAYLLLRPGQVQPAGFARPAGYDRIK